MDWLLKEQLMCSLTLVQRERLWRVPKTWSAHTKTTLFALLTHSPPFFAGSWSIHVCHPFLYLLCARSWSGGCREPPFFLIESQLIIILHLRLFEKKKSYLNICHSNYLFFSLTSWFKLNFQSIFNFYPIPPQRWPALLCLGLTQTWRQEKFSDQSERRGCLGGRPFKASAKTQLSQVRGRHRKW